MGLHFLVHHGFRNWFDLGGEKQLSQESIFHKIWIDFILFLLFLVLFIVL